MIQNVQDNNKNLVENDRSKEIDIFLPKIQNLS